MLWMAGEQVIFDLSIHGRCSILSASHCYVTIPTPHDCFPVAAMHRILLRRFMLVFWHQERSQLGGSKKSTLRCTPFSSLLLTIIYYKHLETCQIQVLDDFPTARTGCPSTLPRRLAPQQIRILGKNFDGMIIMGFWDNTMFDGCKELL